MPDVTPVASTIDEAKELWKKCYTFLSTVMDAQDLKRWIDPIEPISLVDKTFIIRLPSEQFTSYLEGRFSRQLNMMVHCYLDPIGVILAFQYLQTPAPEQAQREQSEEQGTEDEAPVNASTYMSQLNSAFSFDTFYESSCNRIARNIGESVAEHPGQAPLNLLFIHGPSGVGKTHLIQAIGQRAQQLHPGIRVCYVSGQKFEQQYVSDARFQGQRTRFISFYQQMDILIIDDFQFLADKPKTQIAFFEIFNHLYLLGKQIIITCDVPPAELGGMEDRIKTRMQSSLMMPLARPDLDLRRKILRGMMAEIGIDLGDEVVECMVEELKNNAREISGVLKTLAVRARFGGMPVDLKMTHEVIKQTVKTNKREVTMELIKEVVSNEYNIDPNKLRASTRSADIVLPRQVVMYLAKKLTELSLSAIADRLGRKNHTTVMSGIRAIDKRMKQSEDFRLSLERLEELLLMGEEAQAVPA